MGPKIVAILLIEVHRLFMVLGDLETELLLDGCPVGVKFGLVDHPSSLLLTVGHAAIPTPEWIKEELVLAGMHSNGNLM